MVSFSLSSHRPGRRRSCCLYPTPEVQGCKVVCLNVGICIYQFLLGRAVWGFGKGWVFVTGWEVLVSFLLIVNNWLNCAGKHPLHSWIFLTRHGLTQRSCNEFQRRQCVRLSKTLSLPLNSNSVIVSENARCLAQSSLALGYGVCLFLSRWLK